MRLGVLSLGRDGAISVPEREIAGTPGSLKRIDPMRIFSSDPPAFVPDFRAGLMGQP
jgi:hypothetical protein